MLNQEFMKIKKNPIVLILTVLIFIIVIMTLSSLSSKLMFTAIYGKFDKTMYSYGIALQLFYGFYGILFSAIITKGKLYKHGYKFVKNNYLIKVFSTVIILYISVTLILLLFPITGKGHFADEQPFLEAVFGACIVASFWEEIMFRGLIQSYLKPLLKYKIQIRSIDLTQPVIISAIFFMLLHIPLVMDDMDIVVAIGILISTFFLGLIAGYFREKTGSLIPAIFAHSLFNLCGVFF